MVSIEVKKHDDVTVITIRGELIFGSGEDVIAPFMKELDTSPSAVGLDCKSISNIDSSGLGILLKFSKEAKGAGSRLVLFNITEQMAALFDLSKLKELFEIRTEADFKAAYLD